MPVNKTLIDTGPIVAVIKKNDEHHETCWRELQILPAPLITCWPVITEAAYLLRSYPKGVAKLCEMIRTEVLSLARLEAEDVGAIEAILTKYADQHFQLADACLMYLADREQISQVFTIDRKDFSLFRNQQGAPLTLLPMR